MVGDTTNRVSFEITSASTSPLAINFVFDQNSWLKVVFYDSDGSDVQTLESGIDYVHGGSGPASTGTITLQSVFLDDIDSGTLVAYRDTPPLQETDFTYNDRLPSTLLERSLDRITRSVQDAILTGTTYRFPQSDPASYTASYTFPSANERAGTLIGFSDSTTNPGIPEQLTYEEAAAKLFPYADLGDLGSTVLAAISAIAPVSVFADPTSSTGNKKLGQLAIRPYGVTSMVIQGSDFMSPVDCPIVAEEDGYPVYWDGATPGWIIRHSDSLGPPRWYINYGTYEFAEDIYYNSDNDAPLPDLSSWVASLPGAEVVTGDSIPSKVWVNTRENNIDPVWVEVITRNSFLNLPTSNPNVAGKFFLTSTTILNISQG